MRNTIRRDASRASVLETLLTVQTGLVLQTATYRRQRLAWPHRRRGLASDGVRYAGARSSVGHRFRSVTKPRFAWYGGVFLLLQQRSKHPRGMVTTPKASTSQWAYTCRSNTDAYFPQSIYLYLYLSIYLSIHTHTHIYIYDHPNGLVFNRRKVEQAKINAVEWHVDLYLCVYMYICIYVYTLTYFYLSICIHV